MKGHLFSAFCSRPSSFLALLWALLALGAGAVALPQDAAPRKVWRVPSRKAAVSNPVAASPAAVLRGQEVYARECATCHGPRGLGDGPGAAELAGGVPSLLDLGLPGQSDGALFYKIASGRDPMPGYRSLLAEEDIWKAVHHLRVLAPTPVTEPSQKQVEEAQRASISKALALYLELGKRLPSGDLPGLRRRADSLADLCRTLPGPSGEPGASELWAEQLARVHSVASQLAATPDLEQGCEHYGELSAAFLAWIEQFGHAEVPPVLVFESATRKRTLRWLDLEPESACPFTTGSRKSRGLPPRCVRKLLGRPGSGGTREV